MKQISIAYSSQRQTSIELQIELQIMCKVMILSVYSVIKLFKIWSFNKAK